MPPRLVSYSEKPNCHTWFGPLDGSQNAAFAERFVRDEGLRHTGGSMLGERARRIQFWPVSGRARQILLAPDEARVFAIERRHVAAPPADTGALELF